MPKAIWKGVVLAESSDTTLLEGDHFFPPEAVCRQYLKKSNKKAVQSWKGEARFYHVVVGDSVNKNAAFYFSEPSKAAASIKDHVVFTNDVEVVP
jgi:uncharacterized protein (DUF427 family)